MKKLYLTVGVPGSGKSTYIQNLTNSVGRVRVSRDLIRFALVNENEDYFSKEPEVFNKFIAAIQFCLDAPIYEAIYVDATHISEKARNKVLDRLNLKNIEIHILYFDTELDKCLERNDKRSGRECVPKSAIYNMHKSLTKPTFNEKYKYRSITTVYENACGSLTGVSSWFVVTMTPQTASLYTKN